MADSHLVVRGLEYDVDEYALKEYFEQFGEIAYVEVMYDEMTQKSLGHADVKFVDPIGYIKVLNKTPHKVKGKACKVRLQKDQE